MHVFCVFVHLRLCNGPPLFPLKNVRSHGASEPPSNTDSLGPSEPITQMASQLVQPFSHSSRQTGPIFYNVPSTSPLKIAPLHGGSGSHLIHGSLGHPSPQPKWHLDQFSRFCTSQGKESQVYNGSPLSPSKLPLAKDIWTQSKTWFLVPM